MSTHKMPSKDFFKHSGVVVFFVHVRFSCRKAVSEESRDFDAFKQ